METKVREMETVILEKKNKVGTLTLNRPKKMNALNDQILDDLYEGMMELNQDDDIRVIVIKGAGRAFCAGYDLSPREVPFETILDWRNHAQHGSRLMFSIWNSTKPVIAQIHGYCLGGGCDLAMVSDFTIAASGTMIGEPEIQFNSAPPFGIMPYVLGMKKTKELLLTGDQVTAEEAETIGLITRCVPEDKLEEEVEALAKKLLKISIPAMRLNKEAINRAYEMAGFTSSIHYGEGIFATVLMSETPEAAQFFEIANKEGLAAAFKWRDAYFADQDA